MSGNIKTRKASNTPKKMAENHEYLQKLKILEGIRKKKLEALEKLAQMNIEQANFSSDGLDNAKTPKKNRDADILNDRNEVKTANKRAPQNVRPDDFQRLSSAFDEGYKKHSEMAKENRKFCGLVQEKRQQTKKNIQMNRNDERIELEEEVNRSESQTSSVKESNQRKQKNIELKKQAKRSNTKYRKQQFKHKIMRSYSSEEDQDHSSVSSSESSSEELYKKEDLKIRRRKRKSTSREKPKQKITSHPQSLEEEQLNFQQRLAIHNFQNIQQFPGALLSNPYMLANNSHYGYGQLNHHLIYQGSQGHAYTQPGNPIMPVYQNYGVVSPASRPVAFMANYDASVYGDQQASGQGKPRHNINQSYCKLDRKYEEAVQRIDECIKPRKQEFELSFSDRIYGDCDTSSRFENLDGKNRKENKWLPDNECNTLSNPSFAKARSQIPQIKNELKAINKWEEQREKMNTTKKPSFDNEYSNDSFEPHVSQPQLKKPALKKSETPQDGQNQASDRNEPSKAKTEGRHREYGKPKAIRNHQAAFFEEGIDEERFDKPDETFIGGLQDIRPAQKATPQTVVHRSPVLIDIPLENQGQVSGKSISLSEAFERRGPPGLGQKPARRSIKSDKDSKVLDKHELLQRRLNMGRKSIKPQATDEESVLPRGSVSKDVTRRGDNSKSSAVSVGKSRGKAEFNNEKSEKSSKGDDVMFFPVNNNIGKSRSVSRTKSALQELDRNKQVKLPPPELLERLAKGEKKELSRKEMYELTQRNYKNLPEIQRREKEKLRKEDLKNRMEKAKEYNRNLRENMGIVSNANTSMSYSYIDGKLSFT